MWMIYGANGYTGQLTAELAVKSGEKPILAGRSEDKIRPLAERLGLDFRIFTLDDIDAATRALDGIRAVAHEAGPFSATSRPMVKACLAARTHYTDITGEIAVFESVMRRDADAKKAGVVLMPGVGFDVVPTDCMAALLHAALPDATELDLAIAALGGGPSAGTTKTAVEGLGMGGAARIDNKIQRVPFAWRTRDAHFASKTRHVVSIPWGDVSTAWHTTRIPNITTYMAMPKTSVKWIKALALVAPLMRTSAMQAMLKSLVTATVKGPSPDARESGRSEVWGEARTADGRTVSAALTAPEGYTFTAASTLHIIKRLLAGEVAPGASTPAKAFGPKLLDDIGGVTVTPITKTGF